MRLLLSLRARLRRESGFALIEVMMSAMLVAMLAVGVLKGLDAADASSGNNRSRSIAGDLATQDQERLRSYRAKELSNLRETNVRRVSGINYSVVSTAEWVADSSGTRSCTSSTTQADYIKVSSTVSWPAMQTKAVTISSLIAPPNGSFGDEGGLGVQVSDRNATGVSGVAVEVTGPKNVGGTTDSQGCVFFGYLAAGQYSITFSKPGYVDANGVNVVVRQAGVVDEATQLVPIDYDQAGAGTINVTTKKAAAAAIPAYAPYVSLGNSGLNAPGSRVFGDGTPRTSFNSTTPMLPATNPGLGLLFPFTAGYSAYTGNCVGANPAVLPSTPITPPLLTVAPGGSATTTVLEPAAIVKRFTSGTSGATTALPVGTRVVLTAKSTSCGGNSEWKVADSTGWLQSTSTPADQGIPYGLYDICVDYASGTPSVARQHKVLNRQIDGITTTSPVEAGSGGVAAATQENIYSPTNTGTTDPTGTCPP
jgi:Tfp pilus assembly protein PilV